MADQILDASGLNCPLPILRTKKILNSIDAGQTLEVTATDPSSVRDIEAFCNQTGNELVSSEESGSKFIFVIKKT